MSTPAEAAVLTEECRLSGRLTGEDLTVLGHFEGDLVLEGRLRIGRRAHVKATVRAARVDVDGQFEGEIRAQAVSFGDGARAQGVFLADRISVREGAQVDGAFNLPSPVTSMERQAEGPAESPSSAAPAAAEAPAGEALLVAS